MLMDATVGHKLLSFMDAYLGYNQVPMYGHGKEHIAFIANSGLYHFKVILFRFKNTGTTYQGLVNKIFAEHIGQNMKYISMICL